MPKKKLTLVTSGFLSDDKHCGSTLDGDLLHPPKGLKFANPSSDDLEAVVGDEGCHLSLEVGDTPLHMMNVARHDN